MIIVRPEHTDDSGAIHDVLTQAFGRPNEADLVVALRRRGAVTVALVATLDGDLAGHILFSPVTVDSERSRFDAVGLGPMGVLPAQQRAGIGSRLVRAGLDACRRAGHDVAVVLGHPRFYPRFGFVPSRSYGITCQYLVPDDVFMLAELRPGALAGRTGVVKYQPEFDAA